MKKFFLGLFACLIAVFGSIVSIGSKSSFNNFNEFKMVQNAVVESGINEITFYFDPDVNNYDYFFRSDNLFKISSSSECYYVVEGGTSYLEFDIMTIIYDFFGYYYDDIYFIFISDSSRNYLNFYSVLADDSSTFLLKENDNNLWSITSGINVINNIIALKFTSIVLAESIDTINTSLLPFIGNITSLSWEDPLPDDPVPPSPPSQNFLDDITSTINGVINWFVDLFNGLSDIFVIYDSNGSFAGFSLWGNVLFIEVSIMLVVIVLRWVISLIRGV